MSEDMKKDIDNVGQSQKNEKKKLSEAERNRVVLKSPEISMRHMLPVQLNIPEISKRDITKATMFKRDK